MKKAIRLMALLLALVMCFSVAGCGKTTTEEFISVWEDVEDDGETGDSGNGATDSQSGTSSKDNGNTVTSTPSNSNEYVDSDNLELRKKYESTHDVYNNAKLKGTTVKFATWIDHRTTEAKYAMETFEKATGIKVEWIEISQFGYLKSLTERVAAGNAPDVWVTVGDSFPNEFQIAQPIDKISTFDINDPIWNKDWMDTYKVGNHYYMVNTVNSIWCGADLVFYNRQIFEDNGLLTPKDYDDKGEWSLEAMFEIMKSVDALGDKYYGGLIDPKLVSASLGAGIGYWRDGKIQNGVNDNRTYQAWKYFYEAMELGYYERGVTMTDFSQGRVGMWMADVYALKNSGYSIGDSESLSWIRLPSKVNKSDKDSGCISAIPRGYGVCMGAKNPEGAVLFLRYFLDPLNYDWDATFKNEEAKEFYLELIDVSKEQRVYDIIGCNPVSAAITEGSLAYKLVNTTSAQLKTTLDSVAPEVDAKIKEYNKTLSQIIERDK